LFPFSTILADVWGTMMAPIFQLIDIGVVADLLDFIPELTENRQEMKRDSSAGSFTAVRVVGRVIQAAYLASVQKWLLSTTIILHSLQIVGVEPQILLTVKFRELFKP
jgi:hypothetical protein